jgi:cell division septum initiation protein DivIVA
MVDLFISKDEKIESLEKKIRALERKMNYNFDNVEKSFDMMKNILIELQTENKDLKKDRDFLLSKYKELLRRVESSGSFAAVSTVTTPIKNELKESATLLKDIAMEGFYPDSGKTNIDDLFELIMNKKKITMDKAAKELGVDEKRVRYWALKLEKQGLIKMNEALGKTILLKNR